MPELRPDDDSALLAALAEALREARAVPDAFVRTARELFALRDLDVKLATLLHDSALPSALALRSDQIECASVRDVTFVSSALVVSLQILVRGGQGQVVEVRGPLDGPDAATPSGTVEIRSEVAAPAVADIDENGWFTFRTIPRGRVQLLCRTSTGTTVLTTSITI